jgi:hypothetical protein
MSLSPATFNSPAGWAQRATLYDEHAEHQIRIRLAGTMKLCVSCTCRQQNWIAAITTAEEAWAAYNDYHKETTR